MNKIFLASPGFAVLTSIAQAIVTAGKTVPAPSGLNPQNQGAIS